MQGKRKHVETLGRAQRGVRGNCCWPAPRLEEGGLHETLVTEWIVVQMVSNEEAVLDRMTASQKHCRLPTWNL